MVQGNSIPRLRAVPANCSYVAQRQVGKHIHTREDSVLRAVNLLCVNIVFVSLFSIQRNRVIVHHRRPYRRGTLPSDEVCEPKT